MPARRTDRVRAGVVLAEDRKRIRLVVQEQQAKAKLYPPARSIDVAPKRA